MKDSLTPDQVDNFSELSEQEKTEIENKVELEAARSHYSMIKVGAVANIGSGILVFWILYGRTSIEALVGWYSTLVLINIINILWAINYQHIIADYSSLRTWRKGFRLIFAVICLTWGSLGFLFTTNNVYYELYTITFLQVVMLGFCFSSITDFKLAVISISCLIIPTLVYRFYKAIYSILVSGHDSGLNLALGINLLILGLFLLAVSYFGAQLVKKFFFLSFANTVLNQKLANLNKFLEQRVKERTIELRKSLDLVTYQATHDLLTDLPNQRLLLEYLQTAIDSCNQNSHIFSVIFFSINELESINDGLGHEAGDFVIKTIAQRFTKYLSNVSSQSKSPRYIVTLSRKDTFVIILDRVFDLNEIDSKVEILFTILDEPIVTAKQTVKVTASIGMTLYPRDGTTINALLMNSDAAMIRAKQRGGNSINIYTAEINADISKQLELESSLHEAVKNNEFILQYQPFVELKTGQIRGMEALVRWNHPTLGFVSPIYFIALAEKNGVIAPLGEWVLRTACAQLKIWHDQGHTSLKMAVNLSSKQLQDKNIVVTIKNIINEAKLTPDDIELELTESQAFQDDVIPVLRELKELGFRLSIDDFGTGYSGLSNLKLFTIDILKIDKSFINDVATNVHSKAIVSNIINLAKKLHVSVLAEGVETKDQLDYCAEQGCDLIQGYFFSPPITAEDLTKLLTNKVVFNT